MERSGRGRRPRLPPEDEEKFKEFLQVNMKMFDNSLGTTR